MTGRKSVADQPELVSDLIDLTGISLAELRQHHLAPAALARLLRDVDHPADAVAGFQSAI